METNNVAKTYDNKKSKSVSSIRSQVVSYIVSKELQLFFLVAGSHKLLFGVASWELLSFTLLLLGILIINILKTAQNLSCARDLETKG